MAGKIGGLGGLVIVLWCLIGCSLLLLVGVIFWRSSLCSRRRATPYRGATGPEFARGDGGGASSGVLVLDDGLVMG